MKDQYIPPCPYCDCEMQITYAPSNNLEMDYEKTMLFCDDCEYCIDAEQMVEHLFNY